MGGNKDGSSTSSSSSSESGLRIRLDSDSVALHIPEVEAFEVFIEKMGFVATYDYYTEINGENVDLFNFNWLEHSSCVRKKIRESSFHVWKAKIKEWIKEGMPHEK